MSSSWNALQRPWRKPLRVVGARASIHICASAHHAAESLESGAMSNLREKLSHHYSRRIKHHVRCLQDVLKKKKSVGVSDVAATLLWFCRKFQSSKIAPPRLVEAIDYFRSREDVISQIRDTYTVKVSNQILGQMACICRPVMACNAMCKVALEVGGFQSVKVQLLEGYKGKSVGTDHSLLTPPFKPLLHDCLGKDKFVHAEIRMITHLLHDGLASSAFKYLGISKKTCLLCGHVIGALGRFRTRGNHGKIYSGWTLPHALCLDAKDTEAWNNCVTVLQDVLVGQASRDDLVHLEEVKESTISTPAAPRIVSSDIFTGHIPDSRFQEREAAWMSSHSRRKLSE
jgi:hypothetical protein